MSAIDVDDRVWNRLIHLIKKKRVVPVVGKNLLTLDLPDGPTLLHPHLASKLAETLGLPPVDGEGLGGVAARYAAAGGQLTDIYSELSILGDELDQLPLPAPLVQLASIPFDLYVTTTFDPLLRRAVADSGRGGAAEVTVLSYYPGSNEDLPRPFTGPVIYHLLGRLSAMPEYAVTEEDVLEFMHTVQSEAGRPENLFATLNRRNLLLLGSGFPNWLARFFLRLGKPQRLSNPSPKVDVLADDQVDGDAGLVFFLEHFSQGTRVYRGGGSVRFVAELAERWAAEPPEPQEEVAQPAAGCVFLSYASEDLRRAAPIRDALAQAGMEVWFDKVKLEAGDRYQAVIERAIAECSLFVPIISERTLTAHRRFFRIEWDCAQEEARKASKSSRFIVPVLVDDTSHTEPDLDERFGSYHWERLPDGAPTAEFVERIRTDYRAHQRLLRGAG